MVFIFGAIATIIMTKEEYKKQFTTDDAVGWMAIDAALQKIYGDVVPVHYGPLCGVHYIAGGTDPIDGASIYNSNHQEPHKHIVSYGMSELYYDDEKAGGEYSKCGFEFTIRLKPFDEDKGEPTWAIQVMNNLARYVFKSGRWFEPNEFIPANGPVRMDAETTIVGFACVLDPELGRIETPHGEVSFIQLVGITQAEIDRLRTNPDTIEVEKLLNELRKENPLLITDLKRR